MTKDQDIRMKYASAIGVLCEVSMHLRKDGEDDELRDSITQVVSDWCEISGWKYRRILHRIEVFPP